MKQEHIDLFMATNAENFPQVTKPMIRHALAECPDDRWPMISDLSFKNPTTALILSIFLGSLGADRFYIGNVGMGIGKLLTGGGCGVWTVIDWFMIMEATRRQNYKSLAQIL